MLVSVLYPPYMCLGPRGLSLAFWELGGGEGRGSTRTRTTTKPAPPLPHTHKQRLWYLYNARVLLKAVSNQ